MGYTVDQAREYQRARYRRRMDQAIEAFGRRCAWCGSTSALEFDHVEDKIRNISSMTNLGELRWQAELAKCRLLCRPCHVRRTSVQRGVPHGGGVRGRHGCKCDPCRLASNRYVRDLKRRRRLRHDNDAR